MSPSLHTPEVYHAISICFLDLKHDLLVGCASEQEEIYDVMDFDIYKDVEIKYRIFSLGTKIAIDGNYPQEIYRERGVAKDSTPGRIGLADSFTNGDWIVPCLNTLPVCCFHQNQSRIQI
jgi:hypothetical protein